MKHHKTLIMRLNRELWKKLEKLKKLAPIINCNRAIYSQFVELKCRAVEELGDIFSSNPTSRGTVFAKIVPRGVTLHVAMKHQIKLSLKFLL